MNIQALWAYTLARLQEPTTWRGLCLLLGVLGAKFDPAQAELFIMLGMGFAGAIAVMFSDAPIKPKPPEPKHDDGTASDSQ